MSVPKEALRYVGEVQSVLLVCKHSQNHEPRYGYFLFETWCQTGILKILHVTDFSPDFDAQLGEWMSGSGFSANHNPLCSILVFVDKLSRWRPLEKIEHKGPKVRGKRCWNADSLQQAKMDIISRRLNKTVFCDAELPVCNVVTVNACVFWNVCQCLSVLSDDLHIHDAFICDMTFSSLLQQATRDSTE